MNRWLERNGLKLTGLGERVIVAGAGTFILVLCGLAFMLDGFIKASNGVI